MHIVISIDMDHTDTNGLHGHLASELVLAVFGQYQKSERPALYYILLLGQFLRSFGAGVSRALTLWDISADMCN